MGFIMVVSVPVIVLIVILAFAFYLLGRSAGRREAATAATVPVPQYYGPPVPPSQAQPPAQDKSDQVYLKISVFIGALKCELEIRSFVGLIRIQMGSYIVVISFPALLSILILVWACCLLKLRIIVNKCTHREPDADAPPAESASQAQSPAHVNVQCEL